MLLPLLLSLAQAPTDAREPWERFPVFVWTTSSKPVELVSEFGGSIVQRTADASWLDEKELDWFVFNAPGRDDLHLDRENARYQERWKRWYESRDPKLLVRDPCLNDPATRERMSRLLDESLAARAGGTGLGVSLGDEIGLTPGGVPEDVCQCEFCERAWKSWRASRGLVDDLELADIATDAARLAVADGRTTALGPWLLRRQFHQDQVLEVVEQLAQRVREKSPGTPVGLLGLSAQSAFGGVAVERMLPLLDFIECYRVGNARELAFTLRRPEQRVLLTIFDDPRGPDFAAWQAWEHWIRGGDGLVIWSEAELSNEPALRKRLVRAARDLRSVQTRVGRFLPEVQGIAVVHDFESVAASWMCDALLDGATWPRRFQSHQEEHGALESSRKQWFESLELAGAMPGALSLDQVRAETLKDFAALVLAHTLVLGDAEVERLKGFVDAGGRLLVDGELGWIDERGTKPGAARFDELRAHSPSRVERALPEQVDALWLTRRGVAAAPFQLADSMGDWSWLRAWVSRDQGWLCAALPIPGAGSGRSDATKPAFPPVVRVMPPEGFEIVWIHPEREIKGRALLPAGDAAVFKLVPRQR